MGSVGRSEMRSAKGNGVIHRAPPRCIHLDTVPWASSPPSDPCTFPPPSVDGPIGIRRTLPSTPEKRRLVSRNAKLFWFQSSIRRPLHTHSIDDGLFVCLSEWAMNVHEIVDSSTRFETAKIKDQSESREIKDSIRFTLTAQMTTDGCAKSKYRSRNNPYPFFPFLSPVREEERSCGMERVQTVHAIFKRQCRCERWSQIIHHC